MAGTLTIAAGATTGTFTVVTNTDADAESTETAAITLSNATNATISDGSADLVIDDDGLAAVTPTMTLANRTVSVYRGRGWGQPIRSAQMERPITLDLWTRHPPRKLDHHLCHFSSRKYSDRWHECGTESNANGTGTSHKVKITMTMSRPQEP